MAHVVLGVSASVALHRGLDIASELGKRGHQVSALMTPAATRLIAPLQFQAITGRRVSHDLFAGSGDDVYDHLTPARDGELLVCAPATADLIGRLAHGLADDLVTTTAVAWTTDKPRLIAPAMNWRMWANPVVESNITSLKDAGWICVEPAEGDLACGEKGPGRLAPVDEIVAAIESALG